MNQLRQPLQVHLLHHQSDAEPPNLIDGRNAISIKYKKNSNTLEF